MDELLALKAEIDAMLRAKYGPLTGRDYLVLVAVVSCGGHSTLTDIAHANRCSTQAARAFVERLEEKGYLKVSDSFGPDKRTIDVSLTERGRKVIDNCPVDLFGNGRVIDIDPETGQAVAKAADLFSRWGEAEMAARSPFCCI